MNRGEVWWMETPPHPRKKPGRHLVVLLSWDSAYTVRDRIAVAPITSTIRGLDAEVLLDHSDGLAHTGVVNLDLIATVMRNMLQERVVQLGDTRIAEVDRAIHLALGLSLPCAVR